MTAGLVSQEELREVAEEFLSHVQEAAYTSGLEDGYFLAVKELKSLGFEQAGVVLERVRCLVLGKQGRI